jgi:hypothetical protein
VRAATDSPGETDSSAAERMELDEPIDFPTFTVSRIRWHPSSERRVAFVELADGGQAELREGDIVSGALVRRIDPAAVELAVGGVRRRLMLMP